MQRARRVLFDVQHREGQSRKVFKMESILSHVLHTDPSSKALRDCPSLCCQLTSLEQAEFELTQAEHAESVLHVSLTQHLQSGLLPAMHASLQHVHDVRCS